MHTQAHVVVTGGAGFIGSNIVKELLFQKYQVTVIDNLSTGRLQNISEVRRKISFINGDIRNRKLLLRAFRGADYVLHQAALPSVPRSIDNPLRSHEANVNGTFNVLLSAKERKIKKVVLASSSSVYGNRDTYGPIEVKHQREVMRPQPLSPYAANKLIGEYYAKVFSHIYKLPTTCLRYFNVFGHNQNPDSEYAAVIPKFITLLMHGKRPLVYGDGHQSRDFTYIDNVVQANLLAMKATRVKMGESINIACGDTTSVNTLVKEIARLLKVKVKPLYEPARPGEVRNSFADISKARRLLGYTPSVKFKEGLRRTVEWYRENEA